MRSRSGSPCSTCSASSRARGRSSSPSTTCSGSIRRLREPCRSPSGALRAEPVRVLATLRRGPDVVAPLQLDRVFPPDRLSRLSIGPLSVDRNARSAGGPPRASADSARAHACARGHRGQPVLRARARTRARPHGHEAHARPGAAGAEESARAARRAPRAAAGRDDGCPPAGLCARASDARGGGGGPRGWRSRRSQPSRRLSARESSRSTERGSASHIPCSHRSATSSRRVWKRRAVHRVLSGVVVDVEEQARHLALASDGPDALAASHLEAAAEHAAARGAPPAAGELCELAADLTPSDPLLARRRRLRAAALHRLVDGDASGGDARAAAQGRSAGPRARRRAVRARRRPLLRPPGRPRDHRGALRRGDRRVRRGRCACRADARPAQLRPRLRRRARCGARRWAGGDRGGRASRRSGHARDCDRAVGCGGDVRGGHHARPARAGRGDRAATRARARVRRERARCARSPPDATRRGRARSSPLRRDPRGRCRARLRGDACGIPVDPGHARLARRQLAARARVRARGPRAQRADRCKHALRADGTRGCADRGRPRPGRVGSRPGRGSDSRLAAERERPLHARSIRRTWTPGAGTGRSRSSRQPVCANCRRSCSRRATTTP